VFSDSRGIVRSNRATLAARRATRASEAAHRQHLDRMSRLEDDYGQFRPFTHWGPTTDNVLTFMFRDGGHLLITFEFWRERHLCEHPEHAGRVLVAELPAEELGEILDQLVTVLGQDQSRS
jgi:hypothetical protein